MRRDAGATWRAALAACTAACALSVVSSCAGNAPNGQGTQTPTSGPADATPTVVTTVAPPPPTDVPFYTVVQGDTVGKISTKLGVTAQAVVDANGLANANKISVGQKLRIPAGGRAADGSIVGDGAAGGATPSSVAPAGPTTTRKG